MTFSAPNAVLERAEVEFEGGEAEWEGLWRRARTRSRPWWRQGEGEELDLDWAMPARVTVTALP